MKPKPNFFQSNSKNIQFLLNAAKDTELGFDFQPLFQLFCSVIIFFKVENPQSLKLSKKYHNNFSEQVLVILIGRLNKQNLNLSDFLKHLLAENANIPSQPQTESIKRLQTYLKPKARQLSIKQGERSFKINDLDSSKLFQKKITVKIMKKLQQLCYDSLSNHKISSLIIKITQNTELFYQEILVTQYQFSQSRFIQLIYCGYQIKILKTWQRPNKQSFYVQVVFSKQSIKLQDKLRKIYKREQKIDPHFDQEFIIQIPSSFYPTKSSFYFASQKAIQRYIQGIFTYIYCFISMAYFQQIQTEFARLGHKKQSKLSQEQLKKALGKISELNYIAEQLWEHSNKTVEGKVLIKNYIQTIIDAKNILTENIEKCKSITKCMQSIYCYHKQKTKINFKNVSFHTEKTCVSQIEHSNYRDYHQDILSIIGQSQLHAKDSQTQTVEFFQMRFPLINRVFLLVLLLCCELFCMFVRHHFLNLLAYLAVFSIFFLNYFDSTCIKTVLITIFIALLSDICWVTLHSRHFLSPSGQTIYSHLQDGILRLIVVIVICATIGKALLFVLLFRFRSNLSSTRKIVKICGDQIQLSTSNEKNPLTLLIEGKKDQY